MEYTQKTRSKATVFHYLVIIRRWKEDNFEQILLQIQAFSLFTKMGCVNGKPALTEEDLDFIANHTAVSREEVDRQYEHFLVKHPDGKITKKEFRSMMQASK